MGAENFSHIPSGEEPQPLPHSDLLAQMAKQIDDPIEHPLQQQEKVPIPGEGEALYFGLDMDRILKRRLEDVPSPGILEEGSTRRATLQLKVTPDPNNPADMTQVNWTSEAPDRYSVQRFDATTGMVGSDYDPDPAQHAPLILDSAEKFFRSQPGSTPEIPDAER